MRTALLVLALVAAPAFAAQAVWKWVDENGVTHYADRPVQGAQRVEISGGSRADPVPTASSSSSSSSSRPAEAVTNYRNFEIWKPADGETIPNTGGALEVRLRYEPSLQAGHSVYVYLNGKLVEGFPPNGQEFTMSEVPRGQHSLIAVIQDGRGKRIQETATVRFNVRQESVAQPPVGPGIRPAPRPRGQQAGNKMSKSQPSYATLNGQRQQINPRTNLPVRD